MAYAAEIAENALLALVNDQRTPEMYALVQELLRTKRITRADGSTTDDIHAITNSLLNLKRFPQLGTPDAVDVYHAIEAYQHAPSPTAEELEARYQRLMVRVKSPNRLADLRREGPSDPAGYQRLASTLTRDLKRMPDGAEPAAYTSDELDAIARVFEQFTNLRENGNPWQPAELAFKRRQSMVSRSPKDTDLSYAQHCYYEALTQLSQVYMGAGVRRHVDESRIFRVKEIYNAECYLFKVNPNYNDLEIAKLAEAMFAPEKTYTPQAARIETLADAMCQYRDAFNQLQDALRSSLPATNIADEQLAMLTAGHAFRRRLSSMMNTLKTAGFSHAAASSTLFAFTIRLGLPGSIEQEFDDAIASAAQKHNEPRPILDPTVTREWLADVAELQPYLSHRLLFHPGLDLEVSSGTPHPQVTAQTITHLAQVGYAAPQPAAYID